MLRKLHIISNKTDACDTLYAVGDTLGYGEADWGRLKPGDEAFFWHDERPRGFYVAVYDDNEESRQDVLTKVRNCLKEVGQEALAEDIYLGLNWVFMPDGLDSAWYEAVWPVCEALRIREDAIQGTEATPDELAAIQELRDRLQPVLDEGIDTSQEFLMGWMLDMGKALGGLDVPEGGVHGGKGMLEVLRDRLQQLKDQEES